MNNVVLFWEEVPEVSKIYLLEVNDEELLMLTTANECYINGGDNTEEQEDALTFVSEKLAAEWKDKEVFPGIKINGEFVICNCGFIC